MNLYRLDSTNGKSFCSQYYDQDELLQAQAKSFILQKKGWSTNISPVKVRHK